MTRRLPLMTAGFAAAQTEAMVGNVSNIAGAGSTITDATQMTTSNVFITSGSGGAKLPPNPLPGDTVRVVNMSGSTISIYPSVGGAINGGSTDAAISQSTATAATFLAKTSTDWRSIPKTPS